MRKNKFLINYFLPVLFLGGLSGFSYAQTEPMATGNYQPTWESLSQFAEAPEWYKDVKFGIWAHWGPQCQPEQGDWYARFMYYTGTSQYNYHVSKYGNPSVFGFKDVINSWKAPNWNPDSLVHLYKNAGAEYFFAMANHHDNLDMYDSKYQPWNTTKVGPMKDIIAGWANAAKKYALPFGVSVHASHAWTWLEPSQDFDGNLTTADGTGKWWEGLNPQDLYAQQHTRSVGSSNSGTIHSQWDWENGASIPDQNYLNKFYNRTIDLINKYNPDLLYFDDTALPFYKISDVGLKIAAHMYNKSASEHNGQNQAVIFGKILSEQQKECMVWDVERGVPDRSQKKYWQTCTCIGDWHYNRSVYNNNGYKSATTVVRMLIDIVSKNGNLLLNIPVRGDGSIDEKELTVIQGITAWMKINKESIHGTRIWETFGEGPTAEAVNPLSAQGFNEGTAFTAKDIRYVCKKDTVFATLMGWPENNTVLLKSLSTSSPAYTGKVSKVKLLGYGDLSFTRDNEGLHVTFPTTSIATGAIASVLKIQFEPIVYSYANLSELIQYCESAIESANLRKGINTGCYIPDSISSFQSAVNTAKKIQESASETIIKVGIETLQTRFYNFRTYGILKGGKLTFENSQNITREAFINSRNFSRSDAGAIGLGRWGLLADPWIVTNNIINQESNTRGGFDNYDSSQSIGIQKWNTSDPAIENGMIYQTTKLPAGSYKLKIKVHENWGLLPGEDYLNVARGNVLPLTANVPTQSIAYYDMSSTVTGGQYTVCSFTLDALTEVSIGWTTSIAASATSRSMRVNEILLLDGLGNDISANYIKNYTSIQRKDKSFARFGTPTYWKVENFNIPQSSSSDGTKKGIDRYSGYKALMMGVWDDASRAVGNLKDVKMYNEITLPAGHYAFIAGYDAVYKLTEMYLFVSKSLPTLSNLKSNAITYYSIIGDTNDGTKYGLEFTLEQEETIYLGWIGNLMDATQQEFRAKEVSLYRILDSSADFVDWGAFDVTTEGTYALDMSKFDDLTNMSWSSTLEDVNYIIGSAVGEINIGHINFGQKNSQTIVVEAANGSTLNGSETFDVFKDNETLPFATIKAKKTGGNLYFEKLSSSPFQIEGIHKIKIKYNGHLSNLKSIEIVVKVGTGTQYTHNKMTHNVFGKDKQILVNQLQKGEKITITDSKGTILAKVIATVPDFKFAVNNSGIYLINIENQTYKVIVK
ncbi:MAG: alpha-L-fucosidase [Paludibacteraceae bacterium]